MKTTTLDGKTPDIAEENIGKLKQLFPEVFTEGKIDFGKLGQVLGEYVEDSNERYNFTWNGKGRALRLSQTPSLGTLRPCKEESKDWDTTQNLYIEGDNLEVLKLLQKSYYGKVKMVYIDPPYNTGKDFVYKDDFHDSLENYKRITGQVDGNGMVISTNTETSGRYHTDWLNMMYPRLRLARNLLTDDGVIFISIDDNEVYNLRKICDEIFGEDNFLGIFIVNSTPNARDYGHIGKMHEFVLFYGKNSQETFTNMLPDKDKSFKYYDDIGGFNIHPLYNSNVAFNNKNRPNLFYPFYVNPKKRADGFHEISLEKKESWVEVYPPLSVKDNVQFVWRWGKEKALKYLNQEIIGYEVDNSEFRIVQKMRHNEKIIRSLLTDTCYSSRRGTAEVERLFEGKIFSFPKPIALLENLIRVGSTENCIVLDFFSGSATTAHAVMELNAEDGGNRKFIMVQLPEQIDEKSEAYKAGYKNICEIGKERIRRAGEKIKEEKGLEAMNLDVGFKVLKLDTSNIRKWQPDYDNLEQSLMEYIDNFVDGRTELDVVYEIIIKYGLDLTYPVDEFTIAQKKVYSIGFGMLMICLDDEITTDVAKGILEKIKELSPESSRVVFKDNGFKSDSNKTNIKEILKSGGIEEFITI